MSSRIVPLGKKISGSIEYFGFVSVGVYIVVKKDSTDPNNVLYSYADYTTIALYNAAFATPSGITFSSTPHEYIVQLDMLALNKF